MKPSLTLYLLSILCLSCADVGELKSVSVEEFQTFVDETNYVTDAEKFGWSIIQEDVFNFRTDTSLTWRIPNGIDSSQQGFPVTQVSYMDALSYCKWAGARIPTYEEYWAYSQEDRRHINENSNQILPLATSNIIGNVWDITSTENAIGEIRLAGGSYLCHPKTCNGTNPSRVLYVDKLTGNTHIGFSVLVK